MTEKEIRMQAELEALLCEKAIAKTDLQIHRQRAKRLSVGVRHEKEIEEVRKCYARLETIAAKLRAL